MVKAHFLFKTQYLSPVFAERAVHGGFTAHHLLNPLHEGVQEMAVENYPEPVEKPDLSPHSSDTSATLMQLSLARLRQDRDV